MIAGGNRNPMKAELGTTGTGRGRRDLIPPHARGWSRQMSAERSRTLNRRDHLGNERSGRYGRSSQRTVKHWSRMNHPSAALQPPLSAQSVGQDFHLRRDTNVPRDEARPGSTPLSAADPQETRAVRGRRFVLADSHQSRRHQVATPYAYGLLHFFATSFRGQACGGSGYRCC